MWSESFKIIMQNRSLQNRHLYIEYLFKNGYKPSYEDLIFSLKHNSYIKNPKRFNIKIDENISILCSKLGYYPYSDMIFTEKNLMIECRKSNKTSDFQVSKIC